MLIRVGDHDPIQLAMQQICSVHHLIDFDCYNLNRLVIVLTRVDGYDLNQLEMQQIYFALDLNGSDYCNLSQPGV